MRYFLGLVFLVSTGGCKTLPQVYHGNKIQIQSVCKDIHRKTTTNDYKTCLSSGLAAHAVVENTNWHKTVKLVEVALGLVGGLIFGVVYFIRSP